MSTWLALLRGINILGNNRVPMKALASALEGAGFQSVRTYIQSGNVVFDSGGNARALSRRITQLVEHHFGCAPAVLVISKAALAAAIRGNPFPGADQNHNPLTPPRWRAPMPAGKPSRSKAMSFTCGRPTDLPIPCCDRGSSAVWAYPPRRATGGRSTSC